jgi:hypothetical protein
MVNKGTQLRSVSILRHKLLMNYPSNVTCEPALEIQTHELLPPPDMKPEIAKAHPSEGRWYLASRLWCTTNSLSCIIITEKPEQILIFKNYLHRRLSRLQIHPLYVLEVFYSKLIMRSKNRESKARKLCSEKLLCMNDYCETASKNLSKNCPSSADMIQNQGKSIHDLNYLQMILTYYQDVTDFHLSAIQFAQDVIQHYEKVQARIPPQACHLTWRERLTIDLDCLKRAVERRASRRRGYRDRLELSAQVVS